MQSFQARLKTKVASVAAAVIAAVGMGATTAAQAWEPTKPVEFVVAAGTGGGADQMARLIEGIVIKHKLMNQNLIVQNKAGGSGGEALIYMKGSKGDPHKIMIGTSNIFTTPLATGIPFNWKDTTPIANLALDQFVLWVNADSPYKTAKEYIAAAKAAPDDKRFKMGGTGSRQEDQIITVGLEKATGSKFTYVPYAGGGAVAVQLVGGHVDSTVNNPAEAVAQWRAGKLRALCVFDDNRLNYKAKVTETQSWYDIPTCKEAGVPLDYVMVRGIFASPGITADQTKFYVGLMQKVIATPEWKEAMERGAFNQTFMSGEQFSKWLTEADALHKQLMTEAGFIKK
jgi:putative tricarboxylic transport membrane protein